MRRARAPLDLAARQAVGGGLDHLELGDGGVAEAGDLGEPRCGGAAIVSANEPNLPISALASGLTSRRGTARNSTSSSSS